MAAGRVHHGYRVEQAWRGSGAGGGAGGGQCGQARAEESKVTNGGDACFERGAHRCGDLEYPDRQRLGQ